KRSSDPTPDHPYRARRTSGTADRTPTAPSADVPSVPSRTPATASPAAASRGDRRPTQAGIKRRNIARQRLQSRIRQHAYGAQRMIQSYPLLKIDIGEQLSRPLVRSPHHSPRPIPSSRASSPSP